MKDLIILSTAVHAAEMAEIVERVNQDKKTWNLLGFIAHNEEALKQKKLNGYPVLGLVNMLDKYPQALVVPGNEWPRDQAIPRERLATLVDPMVFVSRTATIGAGCVLYPHCYVGLRARIGDWVFVLSGSIINHDDVIGDRVVFASSVTLAGNLRVEDDCYLGQGCTVRQFITVGRNSLVGMGAVVVRDVAPNSVMAGNPARKIKDRA